MLEMKVFRENSKAIFDDLKKRNMPDDGAKSVIQMDQKWRPTGAAGDPKWKSKSRHCGGNFISPAANNHSNLLHVPLLFFKKVDFLRFIPAFVLAELFL